MGKGRRAAEEGQQRGEWKSAFHSRKLSARRLATLSTNSRVTCDFIAWKVAFNLPRCRAWQFDPRGHGPAMTVHCFVACPGIVHCCKRKNCAEVPAGMVRLCHPWATAGVPSTDDQEPGSEEDVWSW